MPALGHALAGMAAGWTVSLAATPVEHIKARLQVQYQADRTRRTYRGPVDAFRRIYAGHGLRGLWHGLFATTLFRSFFFTMWGAYDLCTRQLERNFPAMSTPAVNFWAGGLAAQAFWLTSYPADVVKQRIMTDSLEPATRQFPRWRDAVVAVYRESGWRGYWRGFAPCFLRAFPANAMAVAAFEGVLRALNRRDAGL
jgi:solute carrier family 25 carnitine/acylcarnitine transporter 20/29